LGHSAPLSRGGGGGGGGAVISPLPLSQYKSESSASLNHNNSRSQDHLNGYSNGSSSSLNQPAVSINNHPIRSPYAILIDNKPSKLYLTHHLVKRIPHSPFYSIFFIFIFFIWKGNTDGILFVYIIHYSIYIEYQFQREGVSSANTHNGSKPSGLTTLASKSNYNMGAPPPFNSSQFH